MTKASHVTLESLKMLAAKWGLVGQKERGVGHRCKNPSKKSNYLATHIETVFLHQGKVLGMSYYLLTASRGHEIAQFPFLLI